MQLNLTVRFTAICLCVSLTAAAQDLTSSRNTDVTPQVTPGLISTQLPLAPVGREPSVPSPFASLGRDLTSGFFNIQTAQFMAAFGGVALAGHAWDGQTRFEWREHPTPGAYRAGNIAGTFPVQIGLGLATYGIGKATGNTQAARVGADLFRAQIVSGVYTQVIKLATQRERPDGSNHSSFPSGHTSSAFATAAVLQRHFGWDVGIPAYLFAAYVGAARMSADKHYLSDVLMGAGLGIASGYSVSVGLAGQKFSVAMTPTQGGAAVMFTKR